MKHAAKLAHRFDVSALADAEITPHQKYGKLQKYARGMPGENFGSETKAIRDVEVFLAQLPSALLALEIPHLFLLELPAADAVNPVLPAHVDLNKTCGINVYLNTHGEVTKFYRWNKEERISEYEEEFCAQPGDVWLMDTSVPHSVDLVPGKSRSMLTFSFTKTKYSEVLECFSQK
jgi:hypothetical protein